MLFAWNFLHRLHGWCKMLVWFYFKTISIQHGVVCLFVLFPLSPTSLGGSAASGGFTTLSSLVILLFDNVVTICGRHVGRATAIKPSLQVYRCYFWAPVECSQRLGVSIHGAPVYPRVLLCLWLLLFTVYLSGMCNKAAHQKWTSVGSYHFVC